ncbi:hypothetical protein CRG98_041059 [Punica granatum]|uniref:Uncharacterized protein n=1 Tax=Punica granatum TaxID=22663 RepID=A0A2I0I4C0_PUNGR|nr:hypothetical protein CRG98_041059 [Punica granatum]
MSGNSLNQSRGDIVGSGEPREPLGLAPREVYPVPLDPGNLPALDLRVVKWQVATPSHVRPSRVPGKVDTPKPRLLRRAHACPDEVLRTSSLMRRRRPARCRHRCCRLGGKFSVSSGRECLTIDGSKPGMSA